MVIKDALELGLEDLKDREYTDPYRESSYILSFLLERDLSYVYTNLDEELPKDISDRYIEILKKRKVGTPLAYILGVQYFYDRYYNVTPDVLIPRSDTEILVDTLISKFKGRKNLDILELGIGSGIISLSLAAHLDCSVLGVDISPAAVEVARSNIRENTDNVEFKISDLYENIDSTYDIIVSNPPYITDKAMAELQVEVTHEPKLALEGGKDGLDFYRSIIRDGRDYIKENGTIALEIGYDQGIGVTTILQECGYRDIQIIEDLSGHDRVVMGSYVRRNNV